LPSQGLHSAAADADYVEADWDADAKVRNPLTFAR